MKHIWYIILVVLFFSSCEEKVDFDIEPGDNEFVVVEGMITNEYKSQEVRLSYPVSSISDKPLMISGASVAVYVDDTSYVFTETEYSSFEGFYP